MDFQQIVNYIVNYGGFLIGLLSIILSIYLYRRSIEAKEPRGFYITYQDILKLDGQGETKIKIFYEDQEIERVFTTYIWLWNAGKKTIQKTDIPKKAPLILKLVDDNQELKILDHKVVKVSRDAIEFLATRHNQTSLVLQFSFLDYKDVAMIEIQHTGSYTTEVSIDGIVLGVQGGFKIKNQPYPYKDRGMENIRRPNQFIKPNYPNRYMRVLANIFLPIIVIGTNALVIKTSYSLGYLPVDTVNMFFSTLPVIIPFLFCITVILVWRQVRIFGEEDLFPEYLYFDTHEEELTKKKENQ